MSARISLSILYWFYFLCKSKTPGLLLLSLLSILYWFYFLWLVLDWAYSATSTFNPILVLFSPLDEHDLMMTFYNFQSYIGSIFSLPSVSVHAKYPLSILYWFYFLFTSVQFYFCHVFFQSYIGSIFSREWNIYIGALLKLSILYWFYFLKQWE